MNERLFNLKHGRMMEKLHNELRLHARKENSLFPAFRVLDARSDVYEGYEVMEQHIDNEPTVRTIRLQLIDRRFQQEVEFEINKGEYWDAFGWRESDWVINGHYEYSKSGDYEGQNLRDFLLSVAVDEDGVEAAEALDEDALKNIMNDSNAFSLLDSISSLSRQYRTKGKQQKIVDVFEGNTILQAVPGANDHYTLFLESGEAIIVKAVSEPTVTEQAV